MGRRHRWGHRWGHRWRRRWKRRWRHRWWLNGGRRGWVWHRQKRGLVRQTFGITAVSTAAAASTIGGFGFLCIREKSRCRHGRRRKDGSRESPSDANRNHRSKDGILVEIVSELQLSTRHHIKALLDDGLDHLQIQGLVGGFHQHPLRYLNLQGKVASSKDVFGLGIVDPRCFDDSATNQTLVVVLVIVFVFVIADNRRIVNACRPSHNASKDLLDITEKRQRQ